VTPAVPEGWCGSGEHVTGPARRSLQAAPSPPPLIASPTPAASPRGSRAAPDAEVI